MRKTNEYKITDAAGSVIETVQLDSYELVDSAIAAGVREGVFQDAAGGAFFELELQSLKGQTYDIKYPGLNARDVFPTDSVTHEYADSAAWLQYDMTGEAGWINDGALDVDSADVGGIKNVLPIYEVGAHFNYTFTEAGQSAMTGKGLDTRKMGAGRRKVEETINRVVFMGDAAKGVSGLFTTGNGVPREAVATGGWLSGATPAQILADVNLLISNMSSQSNGIHTASDVYMPIAHFNFLKFTPRSDTSDMTILQYVEANTGVKLHGINECGAAYSGADYLFVQEKAGENAWIEMPMELRWLETQKEAFRFYVPGICRFGGLALQYLGGLRLGTGI